MFQPRSCPGELPTRRMLGAEGRQFLQDFVVLKGPSLPLNLGADGGDLWGARGLMLTRLVTEQVGSMEIGNAAEVFASIPAEAGDLCPSSQEKPI